MSRAPCMSWVLTFLCFPLPWAPRVGVSFLHRLHARQVHSLAYAPQHLNQDHYPLLSPTSPSTRFGFCLPAQLEEPFFFTLCRAPSWAQNGGGLITELSGWKQEKPT